MSQESGINVNPPVSVWRKEVKAKPKELFTALAKAAINGAFLKWDSLAESGLEVLTALGLEAQPGEVAGLLISRALLGAMETLLKDNRELIIVEPDNPKDLYQQITDCLANSELTINSDFFQRPKDLPIVKAVQQGFANWLGKFVEKPFEAENISHRLPAYFVLALNEEWQSRGNDYAVLKQQLDTPFTQASEREQGWLRYRAYLQKRIEEPMFLESFSLKQVYVPLRAYYERKVEKQPDSKSIAEREKIERVVVDLKSELETWLQAAKSEDAIRLISGGPGSGKSSFAKILAADLAEKGEIPVLYIPLHLFSPKEDLVKAVGDFIQNDHLKHNPLDREKGEARLLIIFDGLDELSMQGKIAEEVARNFVDEVRRKVEYSNQRETRLQVVICGREVVVQANRDKFRKRHQILHVLPYFIAEETEDEIEYEQKNYIDSGHLLQEDVRQLWWQRYGKVKGRNYDGLPPELDRANLFEITTQPLLNYLVALSIERDKLKFSEDTNLNQVYQDLLEAVYERAYEKHSYTQIEGITKEEFIGILEEIALACWHGDGRTTTVKEIESHCDNNGVKDILNRFQNSFQENSQASITRLLTAFYFRESDGIRENEKTFEFTHKSFGEYLAAKRLIQGVQIIDEQLNERQKNFRKGWDVREALISWATLCGASAMDRYLFQFVCDEIRLQDKTKVENWQQTLCRLIEGLLTNGMPMEGLKNRPNFHEEMRQARNAEETLLAALNACARVTEKISEIKWSAPEAFGVWIARMQGQRTDYENVLAIECLSFLNLQDCIVFFRDFYDANLERANLERANLKRANLKRANLERANLKGTNLKKVNLENANLEGANLEGANLEEANLKDANLKGTILEGKKYGNEDSDQS